MPFFSRLTAFLLILLASDFHRQRISYESVGKAKAVCPDVFENNKISRRKFSIEAFFHYVIFKTGAAGDGKIIQHFLDATAAEPACNGSIVFFSGNYFRSHVVLFDFRKDKGM